MFQEAGILPSFTEQKLKWGPSNHWISLGSMLAGVVWWKDHLSCEMLCLWLLSALARNFHSASSTFTGFGAPSSVNLILWNRVQGWSWLMIQLATQGASKTLLPDDLWPSLWSRLECGCLTYERSELPTIWHLNLQLSSKTLASGNSEDQQNQINKTAPPFSPFLLEYMSTSLHIRKNFQKIISTGQF